MPRVLTAGGIVGPQVLESRDAGEVANLSASRGQAGDIRGNSNDYSEHSCARRFPMHLLTRTKTISIGVNYLLPGTVLFNPRLGRLLLPCPPETALCLRSLRRPVSLHPAPERGVGGMRALSRGVTREQALTA